MTQINVIDISEHQSRRGRIDYYKVKASGVDGVMIRIGWAGYEGGLDVDESLHYNITGANAAGLGVGLYVYTYATSTAAAKRAAQEAVAIANKYKGMITYPIVYDVEETKLPCLTNLGKAKLTDTVIAFCDEVQRLGYFAMWYTYTAFVRQYLDLARLAPYDLWAADYRSKAQLDAQIGRSYGMWQYIGGEGSCPGVTGPCDRNYAYKNYPAIIKAAGLNGFSKTAVPPAELAYTEQEYSSVVEERDAFKAKYETLREHVKKLASLVS